MAAPDRSILRKISEDLVCPVCQDKFQDPRFLPCHHVYCKSCIQNLIARAVPERSFSCPECRASVPGDLNVLAPAHIMNRMIDIVQGATGVQRSGSVEDDCPAVEDGEDPRSRSADWRFQEHRHLHRSRYLSEPSAAGVSNLRGQAVPAIDAPDLARYRSHRLSLLAARQRAVERKDDVRARSAATEKQVNAVCDDLVEAVQARRREVLAAVAGLAQQQLSKLGAYEGDLAQAVGAIDRLEATVKQMQALAPTDDPVRANACGSRVAECLREADRPVRTTSLPSEGDRFVIEGDCIGSEIRALLQRQLKVSLVTPVEVVVRGSEWSTVPVGSPACFVFVIKDGRKASIIESKLTQMEGTGCLDVQFEEDSSGNYVGWYCLKSRGSHQLAIKVDGSPVLGSPFTISSVMPYTQLGNQVAYIGGLQVPITSSFNSAGQILVSEYDSGCISWLTREGRKLEADGRIIQELHHPWGLTVDDNDDIFVSDYEMGCVCRFSSLGKLLLSAGKPGSGPGEFSRPAGLALTQGVLCICDTGNNRVQVLDTNLRYVRSFMSTRGSVTYGVAISKAREVFVTTTSGIEVFCLDESASRGCLRLLRNSEMRTPNGVHLNEASNVLYVVDAESTVFVFRLDGEVLASFSMKYLDIRNSYGLTTDKNGYLYVCDSNNGIHVF